MSSRHPDASKVHVYRFNRWVTRGIVAVMMVFAIVITVVQPASGIGLLGVFGAGGILILVCYERAAVSVSPDGVKVVPRLGPTKTYAWRRIAGFFVTHVTNRGNRVYLVSMSLNDTAKTVPLATTMRRAGRRDEVDAMCKECAAAQHRFR